MIRWIKNFIWLHSELDYPDYIQIKWGIDKRRSVCGPIERISIPRKIIHNGFRCFDISGFIYNPVTNEIEARA
jgi:hypothetical protein